MIEGTREFVQSYKENGCTGTSGVPKGNRGSHDGEWYGCKQPRGEACKEVEIVESAKYNFFAKVTGQEERSDRLDKKTGKGGQRGKRDGEGREGRLSSQESVTRIERTRGHRKLGKVLTRRI